MPLASTRRLCLKGLGVQLNSLKILRMHIPIIRLYMYLIKGKTTTTLDLLNLSDNSSTVSQACRLARPKIGTACKAVKPSAERRLGSHLKWHVKSHVVAISTRWNKGPNRSKAEPTTWVPIFTWVPRVGILHLGHRDNSMTMWAADCDLSWLTRCCCKKATNINQLPVEKTPSLASAPFSLSKFDPLSWLAVCPPVFQKSTYRGRRSSSCNTIPQISSYLKSASWAWNMRNLMGKMWNRTEPSHSLQLFFKANNMYWVLSCTTV